MDQFVAIQNDAGIVWYVGRGQVLDKGVIIKTETLVNSLKEKYGPYTEISLGSNGPMRQFDRAGNIFHGKPIQGPCYTGLTAGASTSFGQIPGLSVTIPKVFSQECSVNIRTTLRKDNDGMVSAFGVEIIDAGRMYDVLNGKKQATEAERKRQLEAERARDAKPKL